MKLICHKSVPEATATRPGAATRPPPVGPHSAPRERPITTLVIATPPLMLLKSVSVAYATGISSPHRATCRRFIRCGFILLCLYTSHLFYCDCGHHIYSIVIVYITFILLCLSTSHLFYCDCLHHFYSIVFMHITFILLCLVHITFISILFVHITFILLCLWTSHLFYCDCLHHFYSIVFVHITFILYLFYLFYLLNQLKHRGKERRQMCYLSFSTPHSFTLSLCTNHPVVNTQWLRTTFFQ